MTPVQFWQQKLIQLLHDPVHKTALLGSGRSHVGAALALFDALVGLPLRYLNRAPDRCAAGADRPLLGTSRMCQVDWRQNPVVTHPLQPGIRIAVPEGAQLLGRGAQGRADQALAQLTSWWHERFGAPPSPPPSSDDRPVPDHWTDPVALRRLALQVWRGRREWSEAIDLPGDLVPADSRCPDHALYSHTRIAAATCFLVGLDHKTRPPEREPCLVRVTLHGVQQFIAEARKSRDLWTACMIYGELVWAAMEPIVEHYGPDAVLYPDLLGNPLMDQWLLRQGDDVALAVPEVIRAEGAPTSAVPVANTFAALLPRGGDDAQHLVPIATLMARCEERVQQRWGELTGVTEAWLDQKLEGQRWREIYRRQLEHPPDLTWTAVGWPRRMVGQGPRPGDLAALPGRTPDAPVGVLPDVLVDRSRALQPWVEPHVWQAYEHLRNVSWQVTSALPSDWLGDERGFDYPLVHWQLCEAHHTTGLSRPVQPVEEPGEKCTLTGRHQALTNHPASSTRQLGAERRAAQKLWEKLGGDDGIVPDRLGGPAALKRYLAKAPGPHGLVDRWNGFGQPEPEREDVTAPFPSTAGLAAGPFLLEVARSWDQLRAEAEAFLRALRSTKLDQETQHRRSLPHLTPFTLGHDALLREFLCTEAQHLSLDVLQAHRDRLDDGPDKDAVVRLCGTVKALRRKALEIGIGAPGEHVAILAMDGDSLGRLVLGDPRYIRTSWSDVLHPEAVTQVRSGHGSDTTLRDSDWTGLLEVPRATGPSLHAAITRSLADFTDVLVPWVIEVEFSGRLIYAGGDDLLAMLPAHEVVPAAARLQQLYSAPWVVDTAPDTRPWAGRRGLDEAGRPAGRFRVPAAHEGEIDPRAWRFEQMREGDPEPPRAPDDPIRVFPMLGRGHSMSAGAAMGHFKTPLRALILAARANLEERAKARTRAHANEGRTRGHLSVSRFTGASSKSTFTAPWSMGAPSDGPVQAAPPALPDAFATLVEAFRPSVGSEPRLSSRLPYALREVAEVMVPILDDAPERRDTMLRGMVARQAPGATPALLHAAAASLRAGFEASEGASGERAHDMVAGLLLARHLAGASDA